MRWHDHHHTQGTDHHFLGRFKTFPIEKDERLLSVLRYVERNPFRAGLCQRAEDWKHGSAWLMDTGKPKAKALLSKWPIPRLRNWLENVNKPNTES
jgi:putative transposase